MGLADELGALRPARMGVGCSVGYALAQMDDKERAATLDAFADPRKQGTGIAEVLSNHGYEVNGRSIQRHRRGECSCPR